ncbi:MAG: Tol-Pal system protein TolB, partial [Xanthobacteraceae bacterium]
MNNRNSPSPWMLSRRRLLAGAGLSAAGLTVAGVGGGSRRSMAAPRVTITEGNVQPIPIALPDFLGGTPADSELGRNMTQVITADLRRCGLFAPIDPAAFIEKVTNTDAVPNYPNWRAINAQALVVGRLRRQGGDGRLQTEFRLWDVIEGKYLAGQQFVVTTPEGWRRIAHIIADLIYERLTGDTGYF